MAKKTRIDRRGKIRSIVRKFPKEKRQHWSIVKRAQVWERRRIIDEKYNPGYQIKVIQKALDEK